MDYESTYESPVGLLTLTARGEWLTGLWINGQVHGRCGLDGKNVIPRETPALTAAKRWLDAYFSGRRPSADDIGVILEGSPFRQMVWHIIRRIPYGQVRTYGDIASEIAVRLGRSSMSAQAVGGAVGHNPVAIIIPCHRVVGAKGKLTGYAGGMDKKMALLQFEGVDMSCFSSASYIR